AVRPELHLDGAADDHAHRQYLRPLFGRRALGMDLLRPSGRSGDRRRARWLDLRGDRQLLKRVRDRRADGVSGRRARADDPGRTPRLAADGRAGTGMKRCRFLPALILICALDLAMPIAPTSTGVEFEEDEEVVHLNGWRLPRLVAAENPREATAA